MIKVKDIISEEIDKYLANLRPKAKMRRCFNCSEPFPLKNKNQFYCDKKCSRAKHYVRFSIRRGK